MCESVGTSEIKLVPEAELTLTLNILSIVKNLEWKEVEEEKKKIPVEDVQEENQQGFGAAVSRAGGRMIDEEKQLMNQEMIRNYRNRERRNWRKRRN